MTIDTKLDLIYYIIDKKMKANDFNCIDSILTFCNPENTETDILIGLLTATLPVKSKLLVRQEFFNRTINVLKFREPELPELLDGL